MMDAINYSHFLDLVPVSGSENSGSRPFRSEQENIVIESTADIQAETGPISDYHKD